MLGYKPKQPKLPIVKRQKDGSLVISTTYTKDIFNSVFEYSIDIKVKPKLSEISYESDPFTLDVEQSTYGYYYELFEQVKSDTASFLLSLIELDVSTELSELELYFIPEWYSTNCSGYYAGGNAIFIRTDSSNVSEENIDETFVEAIYGTFDENFYKIIERSTKITLMHEMIHYLVSRANYEVEDSMFSDSNQFLINRFIYEGLATFLSETFYEYSYGNYFQESNVAKILLLIYGNDFLLDSFYGRSSVVQKDMIETLGLDLYEVFVFASDNYNLATIQSTAYPIEQNVFLNIAINIFQHFIFEKGYDWNLLNTLY